jgi:hypothetical protein
MAVAEIAREFFGVQLYWADVFAAKAGLPLAEAITFHTNFHRLFAYGNLSKRPADPEFLALADRIAALSAPAARLDALVLAYANRPPDPWPADRFPFGPHFACEAPNSDGAVRIHFRNRFNADAVGPLHASNLSRRREELADMFGHVARSWAETSSVIGQSWLYNTEGYRRLFPGAYVASRQPVVGPRPIHGLSTWGQFLDFRGRARPEIVEQFKRNLETLDVQQPWLSFPFQVLAVSAPFAEFRNGYGV